MKKETVTGILVAVFLSGILIFFISDMGRREGSGGFYGFIALDVSLYEILAGIILVLIKRTRLFGAGILMGALLALLVGYSICSELSF